MAKNMTSCQLGGRTEILIFSAGVAVRLLLLWLTVKLLASALGSDGFAIAMQLLTFVGLINLIAGGGIGTGLTNQYGMSSQNSNALTQVIKKALFFGIVTGAILGLLVYWWANHISQILFGNADQSDRIRLFSMIIWLIGIQANLLACLTASKYRFLQVFTLTGSAFLLLVSIWWGVNHFHSIGAYNAILFGTLPVALIPCSWAYFNHLQSQKKPRHQQTDQASSNQELFGFAAATLVTALFSVTPQLFVRHYIGETAGWAEAGRWSAIIKTSEIYCQFFIVYLAQIHHPKLIAALKIDTIFIVVRKTQISITFLAASLFILLLLTSQAWFPIVFGNVIKVETTELGYVMFGDVCKLFSYCATYVLIVKKRMLMILFMEISQSALVYGLGYIFYDGDKSTGFLIGYAIGHTFYMLISYIVSENEMKRNEIF